MGGAAVIGWIIVPKKDPYNLGFSERNPIVLQHSGVNLWKIPGVDTGDMAVQFQHSREKFDTARFVATQYMVDFSAGNADPFTATFNGLPAGLRLFPILLNGNDNSTQNLIDAGKLDWWLDYWLQPAFLPRYSFIDVMNEPPFKGVTGQNLADEINFLVNTMIPKIRSRAPSIPLTVGWHNLTLRDNKALVDAVNPYVDVTTFHFYSDVPVYDGKNYLQNFQTAYDIYAGYGKPVLVSEFGLTTSNTAHPWEPVRSEATQNYFIAAVLNEIKVRGSLGYCVHSLRGVDWGIYDQNWRPHKCVALFP